MGPRLRFSFDTAAPLVTADEVAAHEGAVRTAHHLLHTATGLGGECTGWLRLPQQYDRAEYARIKAAAQRIQTDSDALVVIGIGGSILGARAAIEALGHPYHNLLPRNRRKGPEIYFAGNNLSGAALTHLFEVLDGKEISVNVVSKSGTTTEPAIAFALFKEYLEQRYGKEGASRRIYATTDRKCGTLKRLANEEGYETFVIPDDVGGRYSVFTAVGLLPTAVSGVDIDALIAGAADGVDRYGVVDLGQNSAYQYATARHLLYQKGLAIEVLATYEPVLGATAGWWKQLFGESEGKEGRGLFPASVEFTADLHSLGQYIQEGRRNLFETVIQVKNPELDLVIPRDGGEDFLVGQTVNHVNQRAFEGTLLAHADGGVPNLMVGVPELTAYHYGELLYFFMKACAVSGYLLGINPFDQPGVEAYKQNMFALLGKPGHEERRVELEGRLRPLNNT